MENRPQEFAETTLEIGLSRYYGIDTRELEYVPVGFGDYHWKVTDAHGQVWFAKVSDLTNKQHCGPTSTTARTGFRAAMQTAVALREHTGLTFVLAPHLSHDGEPVVGLDDRWAVTVFPHVSATSFDFYTRLAPPEQDDVLGLLAQLHTATPPAATPTHSAEVPGREEIETALTSLSAAWRGGPFAEPAREAVVRNEHAIRARLADFDHLVARVRGRCRAPVVTHGEPHPGNLLRLEDGYLLIDWDTVGLAIPERDLAVGYTDPASLARYTELTGTAPDPVGLALYQLRWSLADLAEFLAWFRGPHSHDDDTAAAWHGLHETLANLDAWARVDRKQGG